MDRPVEINTHEVARRVLADPRQRFTVSSNEILALCMSINAYALEEEQMPTLLASLAVATLRVVQQADAVAAAKSFSADRPVDAALAECAEALLFERIKTLKELFEQEFPHE